MFNPLEIDKIFDIEQANNMYPCMSETLDVYHRAKFVDFPSMRVSPPTYLQYNFESLRNLLDEWAGTGLIGVVQVLARNKHHTNSSSTKQECLDGRSNEGQIVL